MAKDTKFTKENASEMGKRGAAKSAEVRRRNKEYKQAAQNILQMGLKKGSIDEFNSIEEAKGKNLTVADQIYIIQVAKALKGDRQAAEFCFKYGGLEPSQNVEIKAEVAENVGYLDDISKQLIDYRNITNFLNEEKDDKKGE